MKFSETVAYNSSLYVYLYEMNEKDDILKSHIVAVSTGRIGYPSAGPYSAGIAHPEYPFGQDTLSNEPNYAYDGVRNALQLLDLDKEHIETERWNPLGDLISPGDTVVLKPNFVRHFRETQDGHEDCLITHGSVIRAAVDYVYIALQGKGRIIIADAPQNDADFDVIRQMAGLHDAPQQYN